METAAQAIPAGWRMIPLGDICHIEMGQSPPGATYNDKGKGWPLLNGPTEFGPKHPRTVQWTTEPARFAEAGDILFCVRGATTGRKNVADRRYWIGRGLAAIRGKEGLADTSFLWFLLDVVTQSLLQRAAGSTFINLPGAELEAFQVPLPPLGEQRRIAAVLEKQIAVVERARAAAEAQLKAIEDLPDLLLARAFRGELGNGQ
jgi:type I restriction enzyme S subunit